ncbi:toxin-antitoxin system HicB family antitoxin [Rheinheimera faecalis]|uniref:toxin-antitoxin system HicB family antitoxin n=1 Tax=Rheinheimera faecalis TaxID=2901141 RepID=UPI001E4FB835|nr:toxin-antitoxin system HicB family antitoxin [Rheinheimera faecalis]
MKKFDPEMYTISIQKSLIDGEFLYIAKVLEIPDICEFSDTESHARELALDTISTAYDMYESEGAIFPPPFTPNVDEEVSGRITLRMQKSLHKSVIEASKRDNVSVNQYINVCLAKHTEHTTSLYEITKLSKQLINIHESVASLARIVNKDHFISSANHPKIIEPALIGSQSHRRVFAFNPYSHDETENNEIGIEYGASTEESYTYITDQPAKFQIVDTIKKRLCHS